MTFECEMMCWLMLMIVVWAVICCICEDFENKKLLDDYCSSFEHKRNLSAEDSLEEEA